MQHIKADKTIGENIRKARKKAGLTQDELAAQMQSAECDISRGTLAKIEAGIRHVSLAELTTIKKLLDLEYTDLLD